MATTNLMVLQKLQWPLTMDKHLRTKTYYEMKSKINRSPPQAIRHDLILLHFSACSNRAFARTPARFLSWDHRRTGRGRNLMLKHKRHHANGDPFRFPYILFSEPSTYLVQPGLLGLFPWWSCRRRTQACTAQIAWSSPHCTGERRSLVIKPPSWWVAQWQRQPTHLENTEEERQGRSYRWVIRQSDGPCYNRHQTAITGMALYKPVMNGM